MTRLGLWLLLGAALSVATTARADGDVVAPDVAPPPAATTTTTAPPKEWAPVTAGPAVSFTGFLPAPGAFFVQPFLVSTTGVGDFDRGGALSQPPAARLDLMQSLTLYVEWGVFKDVSIGAQAGVASGMAREPGAVALAGGFADSLLFARTALLDEGPVYLAATVQLTLPTGDADEAAGQLGIDAPGGGRFDVSAGLSATGFARPFIVHGDVFVGQSAPAIDLDENVATVLGPSLLLNAAVEVPFPGEALFALAEMTSIHTDLLFGPEPSWTVQLATGLEWALRDDVHLLVLGQHTLAGLDTARGAGLTLSVLVLTDP